MSFNPNFETQHDNISRCQSWYDVPEFNVTGFNNSKIRVFSSFSAIHLNAGTRGLAKSGQLETLRDFLEDEGAGLDVVAVSETWLKLVDYASYGVSDFVFVGSGREGPTGGGGVGLYIRSTCSILSTEIGGSEDGNVQIVRAHVRKPGFEGYIVGVYSSSVAHRSSLLDLLEETLPRQDTLPCVLLGDTNINLFSPLLSEDYLAFLESRGFAQVIDCVTRPASGTCIDHIAVSNCDHYLRVSSAVWCTPLFSDHYPVVVSITGGPPAVGGGFSAQIPVVSTGRRHDRLGMEAFSNHVRSCDWTPVYGAVDVDSAFDAFGDILFRIYDTSFPHTSPSAQRDGEVKFRFSEGLRRLRRNVTKCYRRHRRMASAESKTGYYSALRRFRVSLAKARDSFYRDRFHQLRGDPSRLWKFIGRESGRGSRVSRLPESLLCDSGRLVEPQQVADELNRHFATVGAAAVDSLPVLDDIRPQLDDLWKAKPAATFSFSPVTIESTFGELRTAKASWVPGATGVPSRLIKLNAAHLAGPVCRIVNLSFETGVFPSRLKEARVTPLYKNKGERDRAGNYRPISLVDYFSKILEKLALRRLGPHLDSISFFLPCQFGFRNSRSTDLALAHLWQEISDSLEGDQVCLGVFLDVAAAFNCVNHGYFLQMLEGIGCGQLVIEWFRSFLAGRGQAVRVGEITSATAVLDLGTAQGSVLGPYVFLILINFVLLSIKKHTSARVIAFADDTSALFRLDPDDLDAGVRRVSEQVDEIIRIFGLFGLRVNADKTGVVLFRSAQRKALLDCLRIGQSNVPLSRTFKCLGLTLHELLDWKAHLSAIRPKCYAVVSALRRLRTVGVPTEGLLIVYEALFLPVLCYAILIWGRGARQILQMAQVIQNDALRAMFGRRRRDSVADILREHSLPNMRQIRDIRTSLAAYAITREHVPGDIAFAINPIAKRSDRRPTRFETPFTRKESSRRALAYSLPSLWSSLPHDLRSLVSVEEFRRRIKEFLLNGGCI